MTEEKVGAAPYTKKEATKWLAWLADGMERHGEEIFLIENLQPTWIESKGKRLWYVVLSRFIAGPIFLPLVMGYYGFARSLRDAPFGSMTKDSECLATIQQCALASGWKAGLVLGILGGLLAVFVDVSRARHVRAWSFYSSWSRVWQVVFDSSLVVVLFTLAAIQLDALPGLMMPLKDGPIFGAFFGLIWAVRHTRSDFSDDIRPVERLTWAWSVFWKTTMRVGRIVLPLVSLLAVVIAFLDTKDGESPVENSLRLLSLFLGLGLTIVAVFAFFRGLQPGLLRVKTLPNQGMRLSVKYAVRAGLILGVAAGLAEAVQAAMLGRGLDEAQRLALQIGPLWGVFYGLIAGAWYGGLDVLRHYVLRLILGIQGHLPVRLIPFLEYSSEQLHFLQRVGGGYMFVHRYLLLDFARLHGEVDEAT